MHSPLFLSVRIVGDRASFLVFGRPLVRSAIDRGGDIYAGLLSIGEEESSREEDGEGESPIASDVFGTGR